jgi:hypothetical protein
LREIKNCDDKKRGRQNRRNKEQFVQNFVEREKEVETGETVCGSGGC